MLVLDDGNTPPTWGAWTPPEMIAERLGIGRYLIDVPLGGTAIDLGAGIGMPLSAYIYARRPDLHIVPIDPGYALPGVTADLELARHKVLESFDDETRARLETDDAWHRNALGAYAEKLPFDDSSVDLIVSHAAMPDYATDPSLVAEEYVRVLRLAGVALNGPMHDWAFEPWVDLLNTALLEGRISAFQHEERVLTAGSRIATGFFTHITK